MKENWPAGNDGEHHECRLKLSILSVAVAGTAMIAASLLWNVSLVGKNTIEEARVQARVAYEEDIVYRRWNTRHGGVYVRVTDETPPSPYLADMPERDIVTTEGIRLTLINPAYMTRQAHEFSAGEHGVGGHLTSLNPIRPGNKPDAWERSALLGFERGDSEISSVESQGGDEVLRLMKPLVVEEACLSCHSRQDYAPGRIMGGISVSVPMAPMRRIEKSSISRLALAHTALWLIGLTGLFMGGRTLLASEMSRSMAEAEMRRYSRKLEESNRLKDLFTDIMRHDLLNPTGVINCYAEFILERDVDETIRDYGHKIKRTADRLTQLIECASRFTSLREIESIECSDLDLGRILADSIQDVEYSFRQADMDLPVLPAGSFAVRANPMIGDIFTNLLTNAAKYASDGGRVELAVFEERNRWTVAVKDFGAGVPEDDKERIFCRFERLRKEGVKGSGLGLAIARHLVQLHKGRIWVEDNPGGGAVFKVSLLKNGPTCASVAPPSFSILEGKKSA